MSDYIIVTDSCSDLPISFVEKNGIEVVSLKLIIGEETYIDNFGQSISHEDFFEAIDNGAIPMTSQPTPELFYEVFKKGVEQGKSVLYVGVSTGLSGTYNSSNIGKQMVEEEYPDAQIVCFTTLTASLGQALFVMKAIEMQKEGKSLKEVHSYLRNKVRTQKNLILVNDLEHLRRGGRISGFQSTIGSILKVQPILQVDKAGKVQAVDKIRGRNKGLKKLIQFIVDNIENPESQLLSICHSNSLEDAEKIKEAIMKKLPIKEVIVHSIGPVVGSYSGTGAIAVFFLN